MNQCPHLSRLDRLDGIRCPICSAAGRRRAARWLGITTKGPAPLTPGGPIPSVRERIDADPFQTGSNP